MKKDNSPLPSLSDSDIVTTARSKFSSIVRSGKHVTVSLALASSSSMLMSSCSDDKTCTDGDVTTQTYTDYGTWADAYDPYYTNIADPSGSGDRCSDSD